MTAGAILAEGERANQSHGILLAGGRHIGCEDDVTEVDGPPLVENSSLKPEPSSSHQPQIGTEYHYSSSHYP